MKSITYILFCIFLFIAACSTSEINNPLDYFNGQPVVLKPAIIDTDQPILLGGTIKAINDSILAIFTDREDTLLTLVHVSTGRILRRLVPKGRGPGEMTMASFCPQSDKGKLFISDPNQGMIYHVDIAEAIANRSYQIEPVAKARCSYFLKIGTCFIGSGYSVTDHRFRIFDEHGNVLKSCLHYQKPEAYQNIPDHVYSTGLQGIYTVHPDNKMFAFASFASGSLQFFHFSPDTIQLETDLFFFDPLFRLANGVCIMERQAKVAFQDIDSNRKFVYVLYDGKTIEERLGNIDTPHLLVFDWKGNPVKRYLLETPLFTFCLNSTGDKIYGISFMPETTIVQYDLK